MYSDLFRKIYLRQTKILYRMWDQTYKVSTDPSIAHGICVIARHCWRKQDDENHKGTVYFSRL